MATSEPKQTGRKKHEESPFYFYLDVGRYADVCVSNLEEFCHALEGIDVSCVDFHMGRDDFAVWVASIGNRRLAAELDKIKKLGLGGEELRKEIHGAVKKDLAKSRKGRPTKPSGTRPKGPRKRPNRTPAKAK